MQGSQIARHWSVVFTRIYGIYSTTGIILQCRHISAYETITLVLAPLSILPSTDPTQHPIRTFTKSGPIRLTELHPLSDCPTTPRSAPPSASPSHYPTKNSSNSHSRGPFNIFNQTSFQITQPGSIQTSNQTSFQIFHPGSIYNFQPKILPYNPARVHSEFSQEASIYRPELIPIHPPQQYSVTIPQLNALYKNTPRELPSHPPNLPPILSYHQHSLQSPHPYYISHMGYTRPPWAVTQVTQVV